MEPRLIGGEHQGHLVQRPRPRAAAMEPRLIGGEHLDGCWRAAVTKWVPQWSPA